MMDVFAIIRQAEGVLVLVNNKDINLMQLIYNNRKEYEDIYADAISKAILKEQKLLNECNLTTTQAFAMSGVLLPALFSLLLRLSQDIALQGDSSSHSINLENFQ